MAVMVVHPWQRRQPLDGLERRIDALVDQDVQVDGQRSVIMC
jgi:hypothetical protein